MNVHCAKPSEKKRRFNTFSEDSINVSGPGQIRGEMYTKILDRLLSRQSFAVDERERESGGKCFWDKRGILHN